MPKLPRRDRLHLAGKRANKLGLHQAAYAWYFLSAYLDTLGQLDIPKFYHLERGIRLATIQARKMKPRARSRPTSVPTVPPPS